MESRRDNRDVIDLDLDFLPKEYRDRFMNFFDVPNVKFKYDIEKNQYVAFVRPEEATNQMSKSKSTPKMKQVTPRTNHAFHELSHQVTENSLSNSPRKFQDTLPKNRTLPHTTAPDIPVRLLKRNIKGEISSRSPTPEKQKVRSVINIRNGDVVVRSRLEVLKTYQASFPDIDLSKILFTPMHLSKAILMRKIEFFYNKQFEAFSRAKSRSALYIPKVITEFLAEKYKGSPGYFHQALVNLLYTVEKHRDEPEIGLFRDFLIEKPGSSQLLFYIYLRQITKIVTGHFFLNHKANEADPLKLKISKEDAIAIIEQAFYGDENHTDKFLRLLEVLFRGQASISYYKLLVNAANAPVDYNVA